MTDEIYTKEQHEQNHDSSSSTVEGCTHCQKEVNYRLTHRCFGRGKSSTPLPQKKLDD